MECNQVKPNTTDSSPLQVLSSKISKSSNGYVLCTKSEKNWFIYAFFYCKMANLHDSTTQAREPLASRMLACAKHFWLTLLASPWTKFLIKKIQKSKFVECSNT